MNEYILFGLIVGAVLVVLLCSSVWEAAHVKGVKAGAKAEGKRWARAAEMYEPIKFEGQYYKAESMDYYHPQPQYQDQENIWET